MRGIFILQYVETKLLIKNMTSLYDLENRVFF